VSDVPKNASELLQRYAAGERRFEECDFEDVAKFDGAVLAGAIFDRSWFSDASFRGCDLRGASFFRCNVKCADFRTADLSDVSFREAAVEAAEFEGAKLDRTSFEGAGYYGITLRDDMGFPVGRGKKEPNQSPEPIPPRRDGSP
jgi:uncharacterized protein YjbI with pentapeptide repeats